MRIVSNERHIRVHRTLASTTSIAGIALLIASLLLPAIQPDNFTTPPFGLAVLAVIISSIGLNLSNHWLREPVPHEALDQGLKGFGSDSVLYHYQLTAPHVLICPQGVFSLTVKPQRVAVHVDGSDWSRTEPPIRRLSGILFRQDALGRPDRLAQRQADRLQDWLDTHLPDHKVQVQPIIVFTSPEAQVTAQSPSMPVAYTDKRKPSLKTLLRSDLPRAATLSAEQINLLERAARLTPPE